jgi:hypothetical protein
MAMKTDLRNVSSGSKSIFASHFLASSRLPIAQLREKGVRVGRRIVEGDHVRLVDFFDPNGNLLQAFEWKKKEK